MSGAAPARRDLRLWFGGGVLLLLALLALLAPVLAPWDPLHQDIALGLDAVGAPVGPSWRHPLGTDPLGRDLLSRLLFGARVSLLVGVCATAISAPLGLLIGLWSGTARGWVDAVLMRLTDLVLSFPFLLLCVALVGLREARGVSNVLLVLGLLGWTSVARVVRARALIEREKAYVEAARAAGFGVLHIMFVEVLPNVLAPAVVLATLGVAGAILSESVLSYLGLGVPPPAPSWGGMMSEAQPWLRLRPLLLLWPGAAILIAVLAFNLLGEGLRDRLDPRD